jgi:anti-sigma-K factor RskA
MNLSRHPELLDRLAAAYALGTLRGRARRRFEAIAREQAPVRAAALLWESRVASFNELPEPQAPAPAVWTRIDNLLAAEREQATMQAARSPAAATPAANPRGWLGSLAWWRGASVAGAVATVAALAVSLGLQSELGQERARASGLQAQLQTQTTQVAQLQAELQARPRIEYVAVLNDQQASAALLVTFNPDDQRLNLQRVGGFQEAADRSLQLWALPPGAAPRSLGVLTRERLLQLAADAAALRETPALAVSLEPLGGVPSERGPTGPVLFQGALIRKQI